MPSSASSLLALSAAALSLAGCGGRAVFDSQQVQAAFEANGLRAHPVLTQSVYYGRQDLGAVVDEAFFQLRDFVSRKVEVSVLAGDDAEDVIVIVFGTVADARRERAWIDTDLYARQGLFVRSRGNVLVSVDREHLDEAEAALAALD